MANGPYHGDVAVKVLAPGVSGDDLHKKRGRPVAKRVTLAEWRAKLGEWYVQDGDCLVWTGKRQRSGHGYFGPSGAFGGTKLAHRAAWELHKGKLERGWKVYQRCGNPACVNPDHLTAEPRDWKRSTRRLSKPVARK